MAAELKGLQNIIKAVWNEEFIMRSWLGYERIEGLSFWVRPDLWMRGIREHDRPFTKKEHRAFVREQRKLRWVYRGREVKRRLTLAWDALRGQEDDEW